MEDGLTMNLAEFRALPQKAKLDCLFQNQVQQFRRFDQIERRIIGNKFHQKIQYAWLSILTAFAGVGKFLGFI